MITTSGKQVQDGCHLSDGTFVWVDATGGLYYTIDYSTANLIYQASGYTPKGVCVDSHDNLFVVGNLSPSGFGTIQAFVKGSGYTWTAGNIYNTAGAYTFRAAPVWVNVGGTNGGGFVVVSYSDSQTINGGTGYYGGGAAAFDAGAALANTTPNVTFGCGSGYSATTQSGSAFGRAVATDGGGGVWVINFNNIGPYQLLPFYYAPPASPGTAYFTGGTTTAITLSANVEGDVGAVCPSAGTCVVVGTSGTAGSKNLYVGQLNKTATPVTDNATALTSPVAFPGSNNSPGMHLVLPASGSPGKVQVIAANNATPGEVDLFGVTYGSSVVADGSATVLQAASVNGSVVPRLAGATTAPSFTIGYGAYNPNTGAGNISSHVFYSAPNAPTGLTPSGTTVDNTIPQRLAWSYTNPTAGDTQSAFDVQWRHQGTTDAWNTVSQNTPNAYWDAPGGTFPAEGIEWQVRTYDQGGLVSPWSALDTFTAAAPTGTPTITSPTSGGTITTTPTEVDWSANTQQAYQVRTVADNAGTANTATVYYDSGQVVDANTRKLNVPFSTNNLTEHIQVRVEQNNLWSSWADITVHVSYSPPATPTLTATPDNATGAITITPSQPTPGSGQPTVNSIDIWCRTANSSAVTDPQRPKTTGTRLAAGVNPTAAWVDYAPASGVTYEYQVVANGSNSTTSSSAWTS